MKHLYRTLTWPQVNEAVKQHKLVLVPMGAIEQHGPHLPIDTDNVIVGSICAEAAARQPGEILCAPTVHYGFNEHNMEFPGTISIATTHLLAYCVDIGTSLARQGFTHILWVNGHGSNSSISHLIAREITNNTPALSAAANWWDITWAAIDRIRTGEAESIAHACEVETSLYMYLRPDEIDIGAIADELPWRQGGPAWLYSGMAPGFPVHFVNNLSRVSETGVWGRPTLATAEKGKQLFESAVEAVIKVALEFKSVEIKPRVSYLVGAA
jgi:creatinine amidohydrolase